MTHFLQYVFDRSRQIFERAEGPIFMCQDFGTPFYNVVETSLRVYSEEKCVAIMSDIVDLFIKYMPDFQEKIKCADDMCDPDQTFCMNMIIFKLFRYILLYKRVMIDEVEILRAMIDFLHLFCLTTLDTPPINNIRDLANESVCILVNKSSLEADCIVQFIKIQITNALTIIESQPEELEAA